ncbi:MAG: hypothetical protein J7513_18495 [Solirubrobacteraceae bacterium]|nr:hypothetical protein [Solirubrobacteraceae bacterium]
MTALHTALDSEPVRPRGSARLLAAWQAPAADPLDALAADLAGIATGPGAEELADRERWSRLLRRHGGRPQPPRAITDGVPVHVPALVGAGAFDA